MTILGVGGGRSCEVPTGMTILGVGGGAVKY